MSQPAPAAVAIPKAIFAEQHLAALRALSMEERGRLLESACESAALLLAGRRAAGLPDASPAPWPASTFEFLHNHAAEHARTRTGP